MKCPHCGSPRFTSRVSPKLDVLYDLCCMDCSWEWTDPPQKEYKPSLKERLQDIDWHRVLVTAARFWLVGLAIALGILLVLALAVLLYTAAGWNTIWIGAVIALTFGAMIIIARD